MSEKTTTLEQILDCAQHLVQTRGYHAFSYADISEAVGIRKASIHYYFPSKTDLGKALVSQYRDEIRRSTERIAAQTPAPDEQLQRYAQVFRDILRGGPFDPNQMMGSQASSSQVCLCGVLAAEWPGLPEAVRGEVQAFFAENEAWLADIMETGRAAGVLRFEGRATVQAAAFLAGLEGAMLSARAHQDVTLYCAIAHQLLAQLGLDTLDIYPLPLDLSELARFTAPSLVESPISA